MEDSFAVLPPTSFSLYLGEETMKEGTDEKKNINDLYCAATDDEEEDDECVREVMCTITSFTRSWPSSFQELLIKGFELRNT